MLRDKLKIGSVCHRTDDNVIFVVDIKDDILFFVRKVFGKYRDSFDAGCLQLKYYNENLKNPHGFGITHIINSPSARLLTDLHHKRKMTLEEFKDFERDYPEEETDEFYEKEGSPLYKLIKPKHFYFIRGRDVLFYVTKIRGNKAEVYYGGGTEEWDLSQLDSNLKNNNFRYSGIKCIFEKMHPSVISKSWQSLRLNNYDLNASAYAMVADLRTFKDMGKKRKIDNLNNIYYRNDKEQIVIRNEKGEVKIINEEAF